MSGLGIQKRGCGIARVQKAEGGSSKPGLYANINKRKKLGISRPKSKSTISPEAYKNMQIYNRNEEKIIQKANYLL
jgi:hypothetical protein